MGKSSFDKATAKMISSAPAVRIASPGVGERMSREERERMREAAELEERREAEEQRAQDRKEIVKTLVDMKVIPQGPAEVAEPVQEEPKAGRGRPLKDNGGEAQVMMNFRVGEGLRQRIRMMSAEQGRSILSLFEEAFSMLFEKYNV